jgi:hypothetical protein
LLLNRASGYLFTNDAPERRQYSILCKINAFNFNSADTILTISNQINAIDSNGNPLIGYTFFTNVTQTSNILSRVFTPSVNTYSNAFAQSPLQYGQFFSGIAFSYTNPWILSLCGDLTPTQIQQIRQSIRSSWLAARPEFSQCNCFDVFIVSSIKYTDSSNQVNTQITYIPKASNLLLETNSNGPLVSLIQIYTSLNGLGFLQCQARSSRQLLLDVNIVSPSDIDYPKLRKSIEDSINIVRPDLLTNNKKVSVNFISNKDGFDINNKVAVTKIYAQIKIDGQSLDYYAQNDFDLKNLIDQLNYQNENNSIVILDSNEIYSRNYFITLISPDKINRHDYKEIESNVYRIFMNKYRKEFSNYNVSVMVTWQEEYLDEMKNIVYGLQILISIDNKPIENYIKLDQTIFNKLTHLKINDNLEYVFKKNEKNQYLQPLSKSLTFYSNIQICRRDYAKLEQLVSNVIEDYKSIYRNDLTVILAHQDEFTLPNGTTYWKVYILTTKKSDNSSIDLRMDNAKILRQVNARLDFMSSNNEEYKFSQKIDNLIDMKNKFNIFIDGRVNELHKQTIYQAIIYTWNLTAYQTKEFVSYYSKGYQFTFMDKFELDVDVDGNLQTKITYFISSFGRYVGEDSFELIPKLTWLQDSMLKFDLPYYLLDDNDISIKSYNKLYFVDFDGYIDPSYEDDISSTILSAFRETYADIQFIGLNIMMKEKRIGEWGNNVTRLLYYLEDFNDNVIDSYEYKAPMDKIIVSI